MTGKAPLSPTLSIVPQLRLPGSRRVVQERVSLRVPQIPREAGNRHTGDAPTSGLGSFSLPRPHLSSLTPPTPSPLPPPAPARAPPVPLPASRWLPITASCSSLVTETTVLRLWPRPLALLPAFRALRPIPSVRVLSGSRLSVPALPKARPLSEARWRHLTRRRSLGGKQEGACARRGGAREESGGDAGSGAGPRLVSRVSRERTEACGSPWPLKCDSALSSGASL